MNTKIRYIVLNSSNAPESPSRHGMALPDLQSKDSPSFLKKETAIAFSKLLAKKNKGCNFYVAQVLGGATSYTPLEGVDEDVSWTNATADGTDE
jgi:hypothetical protein